MGAYVDSPVQIFWQQQKEKVILRQFLKGKR